MRNFYYIGLTGKAGTGKDTVAMILAAALQCAGFEVVLQPFAATLKFMAMDLWHYDQETVFERKPPKVRTRLQELGQTLRSYDRGFLIRTARNAAERSLPETARPKIIIIPDVRHANELDFIHYGIIERTDTPSPKHGVVFRISRPDFKSKLTAAQKAHPTEREMETFSEIDLEINNGGAVSALQGEIAIALDMIKQSVNWTNS